MTTEDRADELRSLFTSITGDTSVVESQQSDTDHRAVDDDELDQDSDTIEHHGFSDVIDQPDLTDDPVQ